MGGSAILIPGEMAPGTSERHEHKPGLFARLMGRKSAQPALGGLIDLDAKPLAGLASDFREFVRGRTTPGHEADRLIQGYLGDNLPTMYVRGETAPDTPTRWYVQVTFTGCAGLCEVSAELATHWAEYWVDARLPELQSTMLEPYGFHPRPDELERTPRKFLPVGPFGYALYVGEFIVEGAAYNPEFAFELDASYEEDLFPTGEYVDKEFLDREFGSLLRETGCRCSFCAPDFSEALTTPAVKRRA